MDGLTGRAPSSGITTAQLAEAAPAHLICRTRRSENRELDLYTPKSARKASSREPYTDFALDRLARDEHGPGATGNGEHGRQLNWMSDRREQLRPEQAVEQRDHATAQWDQNK